METLVLASTSPRRRHLLRSLNIPFTTVDPDVDESLRDSLPPPERVLALAEDKARAAAAKVAPDSPRLLLAADTLVCLRDGESSSAEIVLGKPENRQDAGRMIGLLSGRTHLVHTGLALLDLRTGELFRARSDSSVHFAPITDQERETYLETEEWQGVAGAYRIQGWTALFIDRIEGSWSGIMGLPIHELYDILRRANYRLRPEKAVETGPSGPEPTP